MEKMRKDAAQIGSHQILKDLGYAKEFRFLFFWTISLISSLHGCLFATESAVTITGRCASYFAINKMFVC